MTVVHCPICNQLIAESNINLHLDQCITPKKGINSKQSIQTTFPVGNQPTTSLIHPQKKQKIQDKNIPLAEKARPKEWIEFVGHAQCQPDSVLRQLVSKGTIPSMILFGPPGCGKTTLARLLSQSFSWFKEFSATIHSIQDIKNACLELRQLNGKGVIFVDEIHRFNKLQQDIFLSGVESGEYTLIGATTENPSFRLNNALLSRCRVFVLNRLETKDIVEILLRTVKNQNQADKISDEMLNRIASVCDGDARIALNTLDVLLQHGNPTLKVCQEIIQKTHLLHDKKGDDHYGMISALHKSVRGSDENAALYWLGRMLYAGDDPLYIARRMIRMASEDIGIANNNALALALTTYQALQVVGMPESDVILAHCCTVLCRSPKSVQVYKAMKKVKATVETEPSYPIPMHLRPASTALNADMGYGKGYMYNPDYDEPVEQDYLPIQLRKRTFFEE